MSAAAREPRPIEFPVEGVSDGEIRLRLLSEADVPAIVAACQDPEIPRWTRVPYDYDDGAARDWLADADREESEGRGLSLLIVDAEDDTLLGSIGIVEMGWNESRCAIGYWMAAEHRGRGLMPRAIRLFCRWIFDEFGFERISLYAEPENSASRRVAEKAGFSFEGVLRSWYISKGRHRDAAMHSLLAGELR